jgi:hypothetical protein
MRIASRREFAYSLRGGSELHKQLLAAVDDIHDVPHAVMKEISWGAVRRAGWPVCKPDRAGPAL